MNTRTLFVENLSSRHLMAIDIAEVEPNNVDSQATRFQLPAAEAIVLHGNSTSQDDKDYFAFTANTTGPVTVAVNSTAGAKLEISTPSGPDLFETEPNDGVNSGSFQVVAGTTYLLRMRAPDKASAPYSVSLSAAGSTGNPTNPGGGSGGSTGGTGSSIVELEPNDDVGHAVQVTLATNEPRTLTGTASKKDRDFFAVTSTSSGTVSIDTGNASIKVSIETRQGTKLFESEPNHGVSQGTFSVAQGQTFVVRARGLSSSPSNYSISLSLNGTPAANSGTATVPVTRSVPVQWLDASDDGAVSPLDALLVINHITHLRKSAHDTVMLQFDMNDDSLVSPIDALLVINHINARNRGRGTDDLHPEGESSQNALQFMSNDGSAETEVHRNRRRGR